MQVNVQKLSPVLVEFAVEIPEDTVRREVERAYKELSKTAKIRGFRPGKAPREVLVHVYGGQVSNTVTQRLVDDTLPRALAEKSVQPLTTLSISPNKLSPNGKFSYKARFEVSPDIESVKFEGFAVNKPSIEVDEAQVTEQLEGLRQDHATVRTPEPPRPAQKGDVAVIDFTLEVDGKLLPEANAENVESEVGSGKLLKELDEVLAGASAGDKRDASVSFPATHTQASLRGKTGTFHVTVKEIKERILPEVDDDFAKDVGEFENLDALKADIRAKITKHLEQEAEDKIAEQLVVELCKANPIPVPPSLVQRQAEITEQEWAQTLRNRGQRPQINEQLRDAFQKDAEIKVRAGLLMAAIARGNSITVNDDDFEKAYVELAEQTGKNVARLKVEYRDQKKREILIGMILEDKILDLIESKSNVTTVAAAAPAAAAEGDKPAEAAAAPEGDKPAEGALSSAPAGSQPAQFCCSSVVWPDRRPARERPASSRPAVALTLRFAGPRPGLLFHDRFRSWRARKAGWGSEVAHPAPVRHDVPALKGRPT
jgi:trigger factor